MAISIPFRTGSFSSNFHEDDYNFNYLYPNLELPDDSKLKEQMCEIYKEHYGLAKISERVKRTISILIGNLISNFNLSPDLMTAVLLSRNSKPYHEFLGPSEKFNHKAMKDMVHCLTHYGIISKHIGFNITNKSQPTLLRFKGYGYLKELLVRHEIRSKFLKETTSIVLKTTDGERVPYKEFSQQAQYDYRWAPELSKVHFELLQASCIKNGEGRDLHPTPLQWIYGDNFETHGRSYFNLQGMSSESRSQITIDGEETIELDFVSNGATIMYAMQGLQLDYDAYTIGNPGGRKLAKTCFTIMCNTSSKASALWTTYLQLKEDAPDELIPIEKFQGDAYDYKQYVSDTSEARFRNKALHRCIKITIQMLEEKHEALMVDNPYGFYKKNALKLMRIDSEVSTGIVMDFVENRHVIIPIHDGFRVKKDLKLELNESMLRSYKSVVGDKFTIQIEED